MTLNLQSKKYEKVIRKSDKEMKITNKQTCNESNLVDVFWTNINANTIAGITDNECQLMLIPMFPLYTPENTSKPLVSAFGFLVFAGGIKLEHWLEMG